MKKSLKKLSQLKTAFSLKKHIKNKKNNRIKETLMALGVALGILVVTAPIAYYLFTDVTGFWTFMRNVLAVGLSVFSFLLFGVVGVGSFEIVSIPFASDKTYLHLNDYFFEENEMLQTSFEHYDSWLSIILALHLYDDTYIKFSEIKELEASIEFNKEMLSKIQIKDLPEEIKNELMIEHKKIATIMNNAIVFIENNKLYDNQEFISLLESNVLKEKMDLAIKKQKDYLIQNQIAQELLEKAREKKEKILEQKENALKLEKEVEEQQKQLKALAL